MTALSTEKAPSGGALPLPLTAVCQLKHLPPGRGAPAWVDGVPIALFRNRADTVYAVQQRDPYSGAPVMSRAIFRQVGALSMVSSPMYRQVFDLRTGWCIDALGLDARRLRTYPTRVEDGVVWVGLSMPTEPGTRSTPLPARHG